MSTDFHRDFEANKSTIKSSRVALAIFSTVLAIAVAGLAAVITAWVIVPLVGVAGPLLLVAAIVVSILAAIAVFASNNVYKNNQEVLSRDLFNRLLKGDDYELSPEKLKLFHLYGMHCTELEIPPQRIGIEQGKYLDWLLDDKRNGAITDPTIRTFIESLNTNDNRKRFKNLEQIQAMHDEIEKIAGSGYPKPYQDAFKNKAERNSSETLLSPEQVASVIYACPNLKVLKPELAISNFREIKEACHQIGITLDNYTYSSSQWNAHFPKMVV